MNRKRSWTVPLLALLLAGLILSCAPPFLYPRPTPVPTVPALPDTSPFLLVRSPARGEETPLDRPLRLVFDQPMDRASVEVAFRIEPQVEGTFSWPDPVTLVFTPKGEWKRATRYHVYLDTNAKSAKGLPLREEVAFTFATVGYLEVTQVIPEPDARDVAPDSTVTVMFNRPVVPLQLVSAPTVDMPVPVLFDPPVEGTGEWINTSIYVFRPKEGFVPGQTYTAKVPAGLSDTTGGVLEEDFTWAFSIENPYVLFVDPANASTQVARNRPITVTFSMPMDRAATQAAFSLKPLNQETAVSGRFSWNEKDTVMTFTPDRLLDYDTIYIIRIGQSARSRVGNAPLKADYQYSFRTVPRPAILYTIPADGTKGADPGADFLIHFASPMDIATLMPNITIIPTPTRVYSYWYEGENNFGISFGPDPSASYEVRLGGKMADPYGTPIGRDTVVRFTTRALDPALYLQVPGNVGFYNAYTSTYVYVSHLNVSQVDVALHRLTWDEFRRLTTGEWWSVWDSFSPPEENLVRRWTVPVEAPLNDARYKRIYLSEDEGPLPPGLYFLQVSAPETRRRGWGVSRHILVVSRIHLTLKLAQREALVWATDLATGEPIPNLAVSVQGPGVTANGRTDPDGIFRTGFPPLEDLWKSFLAFSGTPGSDDFAVVHSDWYSGIGPWDFNLASEFSFQPHRIYVYTDRPIYRPGQPVYFRGVIRAENDVRYSLPSGEVSVSVRNDQGENIYQTTLPLSEFGTFNGQFTLEEEAGLGYYYIEVNYRNQTNGVGFQVAAYRRPEFQVTVTPDKDQVLAGDQINVVVQATYFFGGPVTDAKVHWTLLTQDYGFHPDVPGWWDWTDTSRWDWWQPQEIPGWGRVVADGEGTTDAQGRFVFSVPADIGDALFGQQFTIEATVTDVTDQSVSNRARVVVHKGLFYIGLRPQQYVGVAGEEQKIDIRTVDWDGEPVARIPLTVTLNRREWLNVQEQDEYGNLYWTWTVSDTVVATTTVTTDGRGEATASLTPPSGGSYIVKAEGTDARGNRILSATWLWVSGREYVSWRQENNDRIYLIADKREYRPGDVAKILIPSPFQGPVQALFTVERGHILRHWVQTLPGNAETIELPITAEMAPNAFVSVVIVKGVDETNPVPAYRVGYVGFTVSTEKQELTVHITPDRDIAKGEHYGPRETVNLQIEVTDSEGNPVEAEVGIGVVDKSVLTLAPPNAPSIVEAFYGQRGLGVRTADNLSISVERINVKIAREAKGGGGGLAEALMGAEFIRQEFPDTVFWAPSVRTDRDGRAAVSFRLTDQLTTWHIDARAVAGGTDEEHPLLVGQAEREMLSTKDLLVRPVTPRFFVVGDRANVGAVVHNNTGNPLEVEVSLEAQGATVLGDARQTVSIPAGGKVRVDWSLEVPRESASDRVDLVFRARGGGLSDAVKPPAGLPPDQYLPVYRYSAVEVVGTAGQLTEQGSVLEGVVIPPTIDTTQGDLTIKLEPSLAAGMVGGLTYLEHFPYECTEQLVSKFLPNVLTYRALKELGLARPELEATLRDLVAEAVQKLYQRQHPDGGWGWWVNDRSNPLISAYVVFGLVKAKEAGFAVDEQVLRRGIEYLKMQPLPVDQLKDTRVANRQAFILYVLTEAGAGDEGRLSSLYEVRGRLGYYGRAYLAMALGIRNPDDPRMDTILADLTSVAIMSGTGVHWQEAQPEPWNWNTDTRTTAIVLALLARFDPQNPLAPNGVRWLMRARTADHWETTQETAWALIALTDWLVATKELEGNYSWGVQVNGREVGSGQVTPDKIQEVTELRVAIRDLLLDQVNRVAIARGEGPGRLYYTVHLRGYLPVEQVQALNRGIIVGRVYERADCEKDCEPVTTARVGDRLRVRLTIIAPGDLNYVVVEDPFPAGTDPVDTSLQTTSVVGQPPELRRTDIQGPGGWWGWGWWWFADTDLRDEKLVLFATELPRGTYEYTYLLQVGLAGEYRVLPATAYEMYFPEVMGRSDGMIFRIEP